MHHAPIFSHPEWALLHPHADQAYKYLCNLKSKNKSERGILPFPTMKFKVSSSPMKMNNHLNAVQVKTRSHLKGSDKTV